MNNLKVLKEIREAFQWTWDNMGNPHNEDHFNIPANGIQRLDDLINEFKPAQPSSGNEGEQENTKAEDFLKDWKDGIIWDMSHFSDDERQNLISGLLELCGAELMKIFVAFKLKTHIEGMFIEEKSHKQFILSFRPVAEHLKTFPASHTPEREAEGIGFTFPELKNAVLLTNDEERKILIEILSAKQ